jgi:hypothetical protein
MSAVTALIMLYSNAQPRLRTTPKDRFMPSIMPAFASFPAEAEIIGRLLAGYTNLEVGLMIAAWLVVIE